MFRVRNAAILLACAVLVGTLYGAAGLSTRAQTASACQSFPQTGQTVCEPFLTY